jgi:hypothetical protein
LYSPKINDEYIPALYRIAKNQGRPMTKIVNEVIATFIKQRCKNCLTELDLDEPSNTAYCEYCESIVFTEDICQR